MGAGASQNQVVRADTQARVKLADKGNNSAATESNSTKPVSKSESVDKDTKTESKAKEQPQTDSTMSKANSTESKPTPKAAPAAARRTKPPVDYQKLEDDALNRTKDILENMDTDLKAEKMNDVYDKVYQIRKVYSVMCSAPPAFIANYRKKLAKLIVDHGKFVPLVCDGIVKVLKEDNFIPSTPEPKPEESRNYWLIDLCNVCFLNYSDCSDLFREAFGKHEEVIKMMAEKLLDWYPAHLDQNIPKEKEAIIKRFLGIAHNLAILPENINTLRKYNYVKACAPYLESKTEMFMLSAIATLADILNEEECDLLKSNEGSIQFLLKKLKNASNSSSRRDSGWSAAELCRTVGRLARNDSNKKLLVNLGCLPLLLALTTSEIKIEQEESIEALWVLAFDEENQPKMVAEPNLIETIDKLKQTTDGNVKKLCNGILWTLQKVLRVDKKFKHLVKMYGTPEEKLKREKTKLETNKADQDQGHVMISYQWDHQSILKQISAVLRKNGHAVWMDIDNMEGSTLQAMANAIEGAKLVICCMSQKYKDSPNCRAEAEYAFQLRRPIIPLIMERGYRPDGWLGFILGAKLFYDFSGKYSFESRIDGLIKAVQQIYDPQSVGGSGGKEILAPPPPPQQAVMDEVDGPIQKQSAVMVRSSNKPTPEDEQIKKWTPQQVSSWLKKYRLNGNPKLTKLSGKEIVFLRNLRGEAPEYFYKTVEGKLGITTLMGMVDFIDAINDLTL